MSLYVSLIGCALLLLASSSSTEASRRMKPPLIGESSIGKHRRSADCHFGKNVYELEETWNPNLGPPFGVMYCIRCECMAVQKKRRIAGRTLCKNIKNECPKPTCDEPVLLPGRCCKVCLEDGAVGMGPLKEDVSQSKDLDDDDKQSKDYAAVLTRSTSKGVDPAVATTLVSPATGRFTFQKRHLYFSLLLPASSPSATTSTAVPPRYIQFLSEDGNILEEQDLENNDYFNATGKICGVWRKVPRVYKQLLRDEKLWVALLEDKDGGESISGRVSRYKALNTELLSALLMPTSTVPAACSHGRCGGTAALSLASASNSIHVTVAVSGLASKAFDVETFVIRLESLETGSQTSRQIEEIVTVQKPQEVNVVEIRSVLESQEMRLLMRGQVVLTVHAKRNPEAKLRGVLGNRIACDLFDSLVTWNDSTDEAPKRSAANALAWFYVGRAGTIHYHVHLQNFQSSVTKVSVEAAPSKNKRPRLVEDLTPSMSENWLNGTMARLTAKDYELLYEGELFINVATDRSESEARGRVVPRIATESHLSMNSGPLLLRAVNGTRSAIGWVHVDHQCTLHYDVSIGGKVAPLATLSRSRDPPTSLSVLQLVDVPRLAVTNADGSPSTMSLLDSNGEPSNDNANVLYLPNIRLLDEFAGHHVENSVGDLSKLSLIRLDAGVAYLKLTEAPLPGTPASEFQAWLTHVKVPSTCLPMMPSHALSASGGSGEPSLGPGYVFDRQDDNEIPQTSRCFYENKLYDDGNQWTAEHDRCMMCSCQRGRVVCDPVVCAALTCGSALVVHPPGDCCPMCQNVTTKAVETSVSQDRPSSRRGCHFEGDQKFHPAGSRWHPYLPPFGFSKCAICVCDSVTLKVECTKLTCPALSCADSEAYRPDPMACCKQCPSQPTTPPTTAISATATKDILILGEEAQMRGESDILSSGGCRFKGDVFENGEEWHPRIQPWGEMRCINCNCKDGKVKCKRKKCTKTRCSARTTSSSPAATSAGAAADSCCPSCAEDAPTTTTKSPRLNASELDKKKKSSNREGRNRTRPQRNRRDN